MLPEFHAHRLIEWDMYVDDSTSLTTYDMIIGRDLMDSIGLDLLFSENLMRWDNATVPMRDNSLFLENPPNPFQEILSMHDPITTEAERIQRILDIKYAPADLNQVVQECTHLTDAEKSELGKVLESIKTFLMVLWAHGKRIQLNWSFVQMQNRTMPNPIQFLTHKRRN